MRNDPYQTRPCVTGCRPRRAGRLFCLVALSATLVCLTTPHFSAPAPAASDGPASALPHPIREAITLIDRGERDQAAALLALVGSEALVKTTEDFSNKWYRAEIAKCQYVLGAYADCLDNAGIVLYGAPQHTPFGINYYGALAAGRLQLWPLVLDFAQDPEGLAQYLTSLRDKIDASQVKQLSLCLAVALARVGRFDEAQKRLETLAKSAKNQEEAAALRLCLAEVANRQRAVRAKEIKPFDASAFWLEALDSPSWWVQTQAMTHVARPRDAALYDKLAARLRHQRWEVRDGAVSALGAHGDRRAVEILRPLLQDPNANVRDSVQHALKQLGEAID